MQRKYKFTKNQLNILQQFTNTINKDIKIKKGRKFECDIQKKQVFVSHKKYDYDTEMFMNWLCKQKEYTPINYLLIAILHEIGHIETYSKANDKQRDILYGIYSFLGEMGIMSTEEQNDKYFNIPLERNATMWGLQYYVNHKEQCDKLVKDLEIM